MPNLHATPSRNGNTPEHFMAVARALNNAQEELSAALRLVNTDVMHGRNYQHLAFPMEARTADLDHWSGMRKAIRQLQDLQEAVIAQAQKGTSRD